MNRRNWLILSLTLLCLRPGVTMAEPPGQFVELPTVRLWVVDSGGSGPAVLLLHPRTGNSSIWQRTVPALAEAGFRAIAIDTPGWGRSDLSESETARPVALTLESLLDALLLERVHVVGTAMGGYIALDFAANRPGRTRSLTIAASGLGLQDDADYDAFRKRAEIPGMRDQPSVIREVSPSYRGMNPDGVAKWLDIYDNAQQPGTARQPLLSANTPAKLASLRAPTLVIAGGADLVTPSGAMRLWSRHITAEMDFLVLPEAGHVLVWEQPDAFNEILIKFLREH